MCVSVGLIGIKSRVEGCWLIFQNAKHNVEQSKPTKQPPIHTAIKASTWRPISIAYCLIGRVAALSKMHLTRAASTTNIEELQPHALHC